jgi:hypothetical protein
VHPMRSKRASAGASKRPTTPCLRSSGPMTFTKDIGGTVGQSPGSTRRNWPQRWLMPPAKNWSQEVSLWLPASGLTDRVCLHAGGDPSQISFLHASPAGDAGILAPIAAPRTQNKIADDCLCVLAQFRWGFLRTGNLRTSHAAQDFFVDRASAVSRERSEPFLAYQGVLTAYRL